MRGNRLLRRLRNDPKFLCKYLISVNVLCLLYFIVIAGNDISHIDISHNDISEDDVDLDTEEVEESDKINSNFKFKNFDLENWRDVEHFVLEDSNEVYFL